MKDKKVMKWVNVIAFSVLLIGGFNFLFMGLFKVDLFGAIFGGSEAVVSRIIYSLFGLAALVLLGTILWKAFMTDQNKNTPAKTTKTDSTKTA